MLARAIFVEGAKNVAAGISPMDLRKGVQLAVEDVLKFITEKSKAITSAEEIKQVYISDRYLECSDKILRLLQYLQMVMNISEGLSRMRWVKLERKA